MPSKTYLNEKKELNTTLFLEKFIKILKKVIYKKKAVVRFSLWTWGSCWWKIWKYICKYSLSLESCFNFDEFLRSNSLKFFVINKLNCTWGTLRVNVAKMGSTILCVRLEVPSFRRTRKETCKTNYSNTQVSTRVRWELN